MTANREQQRERLERVLDDWECTPMPQPDLSDYLLDNGVTVEEPEQPDPDPWPVPGSVAIATVGRRKGAQVIWDGADWWEMGNGQAWCRGTHAVTVTSRAVVVTEAAVEELAAEFDLHAQAFAPESPGWDAWISAAKALRQFAARLGGGR
ncbi:hypothetical protein [Jiangella asiatica]|uniref:Uncharacterized protein n=1 Tax=Jiangella asiatica TaxID=2530372 RepID=A0A4R5CVG0_9ACTN|nr:hypothetical protein [Jiangella asiatica]TDE03440.1 hypothetical protein E1269_20595 [Jiangella asiatica]